MKYPYPILHPDRLLAYQEKRRARRSKDHAENPGKEYESQKEYIRKNKQKINETRRKAQAKYKERNREKVLNKIKEINTRNIENLADTYIKSLLKRRGFKELPEDIIAFHRSILQVKRAIK